MIDQTTDLQCTRNTLVKRWLEGMKNGLGTTKIESERNRGGEKRPTVPLEVLIINLGGILSLKRQVNMSVVEHFLVVEVFILQAFLHRFTR